MRVGVVYNVVYQARCLYIGSTWNYNRRIREHKSNCYNPKRREYNYNLYKFIRDTDIWEAFQFTVIDTIECDDSDVDRGKNELHTAEQFYIDMLEPTLNEHDAIITPEEARKRRKESTKKIEHRNIDTKRFSCEPCGYSGRDKRDLDIHFTRNKHKNNMN